MDDPDFPPLENLIIKPAASIAPVRVAPPWPGDQGTVAAPPATPVAQVTASPLIPDQTPPPGALTGHQNAPSAAIPVTSMTGMPPRAGESEKVRMNDANSNGTAAVGGQADTRSPDGAAPVVGTGRPDGGPTQSNIPQTLGRRLVKDAPGSLESPQGVSAGAEAAAPRDFPPVSTGHTSGGVSADIGLIAGPAQHWPLSKRLDFALLWRAIELPVSKIADHFGMSVRNVRRLRVPFGLESRPALQWLDREARRGLLPFEDSAKDMTPEGRKLLKTAQAQRRINDAARAAKRR